MSNLSSHGSIAIINMHRLHRWEYADETARLAAIGFTAEDVRKVAYQEDNDTLWLLTDYSPITWVPIRDPNAASASDLNDEVIRASSAETALAAAINSAIEGLSWKTAVRVATTANITLSGTQTIDGVAVVAGNRVLVKNQSTGSQNGIYVCAAGAWSRSTDLDSAAEFPEATVMVQEGSQAETRWTCTNDDPVTVGTTAIVFAQTAGSSADMILGSIQTVTGAKTFNDGKLILAGATSGTSTLKAAAVAGTTTITLPGSTTTLVGVDTTDTLTNKTLTAPTINGGTHTGLTSLGIRSTGAAFDLTITTSEVLTAARTLSIVLGDAARTLTIGASASVSGSNTGDQTLNSLLPTQTGNSGKYLTTDGTNASWATVAGGGSGTVNSGTANQFAYYASTGTAVSGTTVLTLVSGDLKVTATSATFSLNSNSGQLVQFLFRQNAADIFRFGCVGSANQYVTGTAVGDAVWLADGATNMFICPNYLTAEWWKFGSGGTITSKSGILTVGQPIATTATSPYVAINAATSNVGQLLFRVNAVDKCRVAVCSTNAYQSGTAAGDQVLLTETTNAIWFMPNYTANKYWKIDSSANLSGNATTASSSSSTGALITAGGLGVGGAIFAGSSITSGGTITTAVPSGGSAGNWKLGVLETAAVTADTTRFIRVDIGGTAYKLIVST